MFKLETLDPKNVIVELVDRNARLLAVAKAAKRLLPMASITYRYPIDEPTPLEELATALAAVDDLL
jgi:hypothetical protein